MTVSSSDLKKALKQMADFHSAIAYAADIMAAVEDGEKRLKSLDADKAAKEREIQNLSSIVDAWSAKVSGAKKAFNDESATLDAKRAGILDSMRPLENERAALQDEIAALIQQKVEIEREKSKMIAAKDSELLTAQNKHQRFLKSIGA